MLASLLLSRFPPRKSQPLAVLEGPHRGASSCFGARDVVGERKRGSRGCWGGLLRAEPRSGGGGAAHWCESSMLGRSCFVGTPGCLSITDQVSRLKSATWLVSTHIVCVSLVVVVVVVAASRHAYMNDTTARAPGRAQRGRCTGRFWPPQLNMASIRDQEQSLLVLHGPVFNAISLVLTSKRRMGSVEISRRHELGTNHQRLSANEHRLGLLSKTQGTPVPGPGHRDERQGYPAAASCFVCSCSRLILLFLIRPPTR